MASPTKEEDWSWRPQEKSPLGVVGRQGSSGELEQSQLMKDLYDSVERETDLKEQLKFMEEEARNMRRKLADLEEENESLNLQVKKMSKQRRQQQAGGTGGGLAEPRLSAEEGSDSDLSDVDSTLQLELLEQELAVTRKKMAEGEAERERLEVKVKELTEVTEAQARELSLRPERAPSPVVPDQYWEEKLRLIRQDCDELRWRLIEKEREVERLSTQAQHKELISRKGRLKKSKSLDSDNPQVWELKKHSETLTQEANTLRDMLALEQAETARLTALNQTLEDALAQKQKVPAIVADDAALVNIELRDRNHALEAERRALQERVRMLTESLQTVARGGERARAEATAGIPASPSPTRSPASSSPSSSPTLARSHDRGGEEPRDSARQVELLVEENLGLRRRLAELESTKRTTRERRGVGGGSGGEGSRRGREAAEAVVAAAAAAEESEAGSPPGTQRHATRSEGEPQQAQGKMADKAKEEGIATGESRVELMERVMDLEDELSDLQVQMRHKEEQYASLERDMATLRTDMEAERQEYETQLTEVRAEVDMLQEKNAVLSNLLDIVQERADEVEGELERFAREASASPSDRSASNVSALSDASVGSDEVFVGNLHADKGNAILKDWDSQMKKRVASLERLLAEERQKVAMAEKKLALAAPHDVTSAISDDVKLHLREKEILQEEVLQNQKCLRVASDQIKGLKERIHILEDEHRRLKEDYGKVCDEVLHREDASKMADEVFKEDSAPKTEAASKQPAQKPASSDQDKDKLLQDLAQYKLKAEELEYKVEELNEVWRSKSAASASEKAQLETTIKERDKDILQLREQVTKLQADLDSNKTKVTTLQSTLDAKSRDLSARKAEAVQQEELTSHRDATLRELREAVRTRDERLREKDEIIGKLNSVAERQRAQLTALGDTMRDVSKRLEAKEAMVSRLQEQVNAVTLTSAGVGQTDLEKDNARLRHLLTSTQGELERMRQDLVGLKADVTKGRQEQESGALQWMQEKAAMQADMNALEEKLRLYEVHATMQKGDVVATLRREAHEHFREKERLAGELGALKRSAELAARHYREELATLQRDLAEQAKRLGEEAEVRHRQQQDIERLRGQAEVATRAQKEERLLRAEHVALQVQSEAAHERLSREVSRLTAINNRLQKEHELDRDMIAGLQRTLATAKAEHSHERQLWEDERCKMEEDLKEIIQLRDEMGLIRHQALELQQRLVEAQRSRDDSAAQLIAQRSAWDIERTKLQSRINQMEERVALTERSQDGSRKRELETAWSRERAEQQRLLEEAHKLALDLQQQLRSRDQDIARERLEMLRQHEMDRERWEKERREKDKKLSELEQQARRHSGWQARYTQLQEAMERDLQQALRERKLYLQRLTEARAQHQRDVKAVEDILHGLIRLRELGVLLTQAESDVPSDVTVYPPEMKGDSGLRVQAVTQSQEAPSHPDQTLVQHIKDALTQINQAAGEISKQVKYSDPKWQVRRSLSSSELDLLREELEADDVVLESSSTLPRRHDVTATTASSLTSAPTSRLFDRPAPYLSGTRSAHTSRAGSPSVLSPVSSLPSPPPSFIVPHKPGERPSRPKTLVKSMSLDVPGSAYLEPSSQSLRSVSASTTPTQGHAPSGHAHLGPSRGHAPGRLGPPTASSMENLSPRTARKQFFEGHARAQSVSSAEPFGLEASGFMSWPERKSHAAAALRRTPVDEEAMIRDAEHGQSATTSSRLVMSSSCDEKMLHGILVPPQAATPTRSTTPTGAVSQKEGSALSAKEKRKFFKKSSSLDSTVGTSIAKVGVQAMPVAAPSGFSPSDIFAAVKGKFKGKKAKDGSKGHSRPTSPISTVEEEPSSTTSTSRSEGTEPGDQTSPTDARPGQTTTSHRTPEEAADSSRQGRSSRQSKETLSPPGDSASKRWRSKSAERPRSQGKPILLHADVTGPTQLWQFSETAV